MEVLQKITIYDLLGYTVPGSILIGIMVICFYKPDIQFLLGTYEKQWGYIFAVIILLGYVTGLVLAQFGKIFFCPFNFFMYKWRGRDKHNEAVRLGKDRIKEALIKSGVDGKQLKSLNEKQMVKRYSGYMFADLQTDSKYSRIHNYASSELVCGNLTLALLIGGILLWGYEVCGKDLVKTILYFAAIALLIARYELQRMRKEDYALDWFVQKYNGKKHKGEN